MEATQKLNPAVGDRLRHHGGSVWEVRERDLPGNGEWGTGRDQGMILIRGDYRLHCVAHGGQEQGRTMRVHDEYLQRSFAALDTDGAA